MRLDGSSSRRYQNILHIIGSAQSGLILLGAILIQKDNYIWGVGLMFIGATMLRVVSELEYRKLTVMFKEKNESLLQGKLPTIRRDNTFLS